MLLTKMHKFETQLIELNHERFMGKIYQSDYKSKKIDLGPAMPGCSGNSQEVV